MGRHSVDEDTAFTMLMSRGEDGAPLVEAAQAVIASAGRRRR
jgi:hypothetical protein